MCVCEIVSPAGDSSVINTQCKYLERIHKEEGGGDQPTVRNILKTWMDGKRKCFNVKRLKYHRLDTIYNFCSLHQKPRGEKPNRNAPDPSVHVFITATLNPCDFTSCSVSHQSSVELISQCKHGRFLKLVPHEKYFEAEYFPNEFSISKWRLSERVAAWYVWVTALGISPRTWCRVWNSFYPRSLIISGP